jgi:hypothetical protein
MESNQRGIARGLLEIVPRAGHPLRVGARALVGQQGESLLEELFERIGAECVQLNLVGCGDIRGLIVSGWSLLLSSLSQFGLLGLSIGRNSFLHSVCPAVCSTEYWS